MTLETSPARRHVISQAAYHRAGMTSRPIWAKACRKDPVMTMPSLKERALHDPQSVFATPEAVIQSDQLPPEHKRTILERWRQLIGSPPLEQSEAAGAPSLATRLTRALAFLDTETGGHQVTHDQGFYTAIGDIGRDQAKKDQ